ncbi:MAG: hypothetical protein FE78DRAFT_66710 [Acidomyces sp. 'richmondensis']|nr:MAG: hypothetical protein FE78DRAFT_66710 [Acidomyces sp. 'richmondensis']
MHARRGVCDLRTSRTTGQPRRPPTRRHHPGDLAKQKPCAARPTSPIQPHMQPCFLEKKPMVPGGRPRPDANTLPKGAEVGPRLGEGWDNAGKSNDVSRGTFELFAAAKQDNPDPRPVWRTGPAAHPQRAGHSRMSGHSGSSRSNGSGGGGGGGGSSIRRSSSSSSSRLCRHLSTPTASAAQGVRRRHDAPQGNPRWVRPDRPDCTAGRSRMRRGAAFRSIEIVPSHVAQSRLVDGTNQIA